MMTLIRGSDSAPSLLGESGVEITYRDPAERVRRFAGQLRDRCSLVVIAPERCAEAVVFYFTHGHVPVLIPPGQPEFLAKIETLSTPNWTFTRMEDKWDLLSRQNGPVALYPDLAVLLSTPGASGAIKFVRLSLDNVVSNADLIRQNLTIASSERAMLSLPFHCFYGLSVLKGHPLAGATLILTEPQLPLESPDCIGVAVLRGRLSLVDVDGRPVGVAEQEGEPFYDGPNEMLGYATGRDDLNTGRSIESLRGRKRRFQRWSSTGRKQVKTVKTSLID